MFFAMSLFAQPPETKMNFSRYLKTITWIFLITYLLAGSTGGFSRCHKNAAHNGQTAVNGLERAPQSIQEAAAGSPPSLQNHKAGNRLCLQITPALVSTANLSILESSGKWPSKTPGFSPQIGSLLPLATGRAGSNLFRQRPPLINPRLTHIRTVVLLA